MSDSNPTVKQLAEQNGKNLKAIAKHLGIEKKLKQDVGGTKWASKMRLTTEKNSEGMSEVEQTAALLEQNAENLLQLANELGVSKHRLAGRATETKWSKTLRLPRSGE